MTGSASDPADWQPHIRNKPRREALANRFRDAERPVPARDRARHVADRLRRALPAHDVRGQADARPRADAGDRPGEPGVQGQARRPGGGLPRPRRRAEAGAGHLHRERRHRAHGARPGRGRGRDAGEVRGLLRPLPRLRLVAVDDRHAAGAARPAAARRRSTSWRRRTARTAACSAVRELSQAFALAVPHDEALRIRDDVAFFQAVRAVLAKRAPGDARPEEELDHAIRQIVSRAVAPEGVIDIFAAAGLEEAGHLDPLRRVPGRGARDAAAEPRGGAAAEAAEGRDNARAGARTSCRRARSPRCWSRRSAATRTAPSRPRR